MTKTISQRLSEPLDKDDIELRIGSTFAKGFTLLLYKTARADVKRLNEVCGLHWKNRHFYDDEKLLCCEISVYDSEAKEWIGRSDVGTESNTEKEKGYYSDSFKRAGFRWGIGAELYNSPFVFINWEMKEKTDSYTNKKKFEPKDFYSSKLDFSEYKVVDGFPQFTLTYDGKEVWSNIKKVTQERKNPMLATDGAPQNAGFKNAKAGIDDWKEKMAKLNAIDTVGKLDKARKGIEEYIENLAKWDAGIAENFREAYEKKREEIGDFIDDEIPTFE